MVDVHDGIAGDGFAVPLRLHNLLLGLAGRLDDSLLSEARELIARARLDEAAELTTGALIAGRLPVREAERHELALVLELTRSDATLADQLVVNDPEAETGVLHRFTGDNQPEHGIADALDRTLQVLPDLRSVHAVWRNTPAGSVPGPLPQRVVLVEIGPEGNPPAAAYRIDAALRRAGIRSVVEVTGPSTERSRYHEQALTAATAVWLSGGAVPSSAPTAPAQRQGSGRHVAHATVAAGDEPEEPEPPAAEETTTTEAAAETEPTEVVASPSGPGHVFKPREEGPEPSRVENTMDMTSEEVAQLRAQLAAEDGEKPRAVASATIGPGEVIEIPELDLNDPQLSERDRQLLRELHAELAERERAEAAKVRANGSSRSEDDPRWVDGFSGS
ncbi:MULTISPECIES: hypothetical protein [Amycolatopsis]|uniref:DUF222 domain-containing protein n=1 Tax=Amycolatopsis tucumanensis TaxID=401106 RepID=A0ABP7HPC4_9PSEU|nr:MULTISPECIES: hypothetical protein [Amycolatopsis]MCF6428917.1 hypothetical protein [Amycolatopsis tucumanensis]